MTNNLFDQLDFGQFDKFIKDDDITDISYCNNGQIWIRSLKNGSLRIENHGITNAAVEKLAFQCSNVMGTTFNTAKPFLDAESSELRMNFVHDSVATNGIALVIRKTPAKIRLKEEKLLEDNYITKDIHDFLIKCVLGHCNIMVCGETGSGKTEFVKYLASHTKESEKIITIEDTLELHLDRIYPNRDIVSMKTNNIASYSDVLVTCMRQNPKWILLSEVRSAEAVTAVRNSISSGHNILSTIHSDKASAIPHRLYSLMETDLDVDQFLNTIYRYIQLGVHIKAYYSKEKQKFHREIDEITEFYVDEDNKPVFNVIYQRSMTGKIIKKEISKHLREYLENQNINLEVPIELKNGLDPDIDKLVEDEMKEKFSVKEESKEEEPINYIDSAINFDKPINNDNNVNNISMGRNMNFNGEVGVPLTFKVEEEPVTESVEVVNADVSENVNNSVNEDVNNLINNVIDDNMEVPLPPSLNQPSLEPVSNVNENNISINNDVLNNQNNDINSVDIQIPTSDSQINLEPVGNNNTKSFNIDGLNNQNNNIENVEIQIPTFDNQPNLEPVGNDNTITFNNGDLNNQNNDIENIEIPVPTFDNQPNLEMVATDNNISVNNAGLNNSNNDINNVEIPLPFDIQINSNGTSIENNDNMITNDNIVSNNVENINNNDDNILNDRPVSQTNRFIQNIDATI